MMFKCEFPKEMSGCRDNNKSEKYWTLTMDYVIYISVCTGLSLVNDLLTQKVWADTDWEKKSLQVYRWTEPHTRSSSPYITILQNKSFHHNERKETFNRPALYRHWWSFVWTYDGCIIWSVKMVIYVSRK